MNITKKINSILGDKRSIDYWSSTKSSKEIKHLKKCDSFLETVDERVEKLTKKIKQLNAEAKKISKSRDEYRDLYKASQLQLQTQVVEEGTKDVSDKERSEEFMPMDEYLALKEKEVDSLRNDNEILSIGFKNEIALKEIRDVILTAYVFIWKETSKSYTIKDDISITFDLMVNKYSLTKELTTMTSNIYEKRYKKLIEFLAYLKKIYHMSNKINSVLTETIFMSNCIEILSFGHLSNHMAQDLYDSIYGDIFDYEVKVIKNLISSKDSDTDISLRNLVEPIFKSMNERNQSEIDCVECERDLIMLLATDIESGSISEFDIATGKLSEDSNCPFSVRYLKALISSLEIINVAIHLDLLPVSINGWSVRNILEWYIRNRVSITTDDKDALITGKLSTVMDIIEGGYKLSK